MSGVIIQMNHHTAESIPLTRIFSNNPPAPEYEGFIGWVLGLIDQLGELGVGSRCSLVGVCRS